MKVVWNPRGLVGTGSVPEVFSNLLLLNVTGNLGGAVGVLEPQVSHTGSSFEESPKSVSAED